HIIAGLIFNDKWKNVGDIVDLESLKTLVQSLYFPRTPQEKADYLLLELYKIQKEEGELIDIEKLFFLKKEWKSLYFKSYSEANFYLKHLQSQGLINAFTSNHLIFGLIVNSASISFNGLSHIIHLQDEGEKSKNCF